MPASTSRPMSPSNAADRPVRCDCGALVARLVPGGVELKCRRCKRTHVVPLEDGHRPDR